MQRRAEDGEGVVVRHSPNGITVTGISLAFIISALSVVFTFGQQKEKIAALEVTSQKMAEKIDKVSEKVDNLSGKMDILISREHP